MNFITDKEIYNILDLKECYTWAETMIKNKNSAILPPKISMKLENHIFYNVMPCVLPEYNVAGIKVVNRYPTNNPSLKSSLMLYDLHNGDLLSIMDANAITTIRTGAVAAHSALLFSNKDFKTVSAIGLGNVTTMALEFFLDQTKNRTFTLKLFNYKNHAQTFIKNHSNYSNINFVIVDSYDDLMVDSDIIFSGITYAEKDFCDISKYKKGCTIIPIHTLGFQNCDLVFDKIFGDDLGHIQGFKYFNEFKSFNEVTDVLNNKAVGRSSSDERILAYNIGIAIHDIYYAKKIYDKLNN